MRDLINIPFLRKKATPTKEEIFGDLPDSRVSEPNFQQGFDLIKGSLKFVSEDFHKELIPTIRKLLVINSSLSLAITDSVQLCNPGYNIDFDSKVTLEEAQKMRHHLETVSKQWTPASPGIYGIINKLIYQVYIGGAISTEWVVNQSKTGVEALAFVPPEQIRAAYNEVTRKYEYFQKAPLRAAIVRKELVDLIPLNSTTFKYYELINDTEEPRAIPPFVSALLDLSTQTNILKNIGLVSDQYGLMGFLQLLLKKPTRKDGESETAFKARLTTIAQSAKASVLGGLKDGVVVGYKDDHEFDFFNVAKNASGLKEIFDIIHRVVANGLFTSPAFQGGATGGSETHINIIFTKMLSQMENIHRLVKETLEYGFWLELTLAGFKFSEVKLEFKESTITDALKNAQVREIQIRNSRTLYADGQYSQDQYARSIGLDKPDQKEPRVPIDAEKVQGDAADKKQREKDKDSSDRKVREKNKPQPKRNDQK
jgi:hypothetical protein